MPDEPKNSNVQKMHALTPEVRTLIERDYGLPVTGRTDAELRAELAAAGLARRAIADLQPKTVNLEARTCDITIATEDAVRVLDTDSWEMVDEVLLMSGLRLAAVRRAKLPLLDSHQRGSTRNVLGSVIDLAVTAREFRGREVYSKIAEPELVKTAEGHLDQRSIGYRVLAAIRVEPGESTTVNGKTFTASAGRALKVATDWEAVEVSIVPVAADPAAGTRSASPPPAAPPADPPAGTRAVPAPALPVETNPPTPVPQNVQKENSAMNPQLRAQLEKLGLDPKATEAEAQAFLARADIFEKVGKLAFPPPQPAQPPAAAPDPDAAVRAEAERVSEIRGVFAPYLAQDGVRELADKAAAVGSKVTADQARAQLLKHLADKTPPTPRVQVVADEADKRRACLSAAIQVRAPEVFPKIDEPTRKAAQEFAGLTLLDMCRLSLEANGVSTRGMDRLTIVGRAFTHSTGDFPYILENTARKAMLDAFARAPVTWDQWTMRGNLSDFKTARRVNLGEAGVLPEVPEGAEFPQHTLTENRESITLKSFGKIFAITRQAIINDDLGAFSRVPALHSRAWARTINQEAVKVLLSNAALTDTVALFHATHSNLDESTATINSVATAAAVIRALAKALLQQKDLDGTSPLGLQPAVVLACPTLSEYLIQAVYETGRADSNVGVDIRRMGLKVAVEAEIENSTLTGYGVNLTYLFANPADAPVVEVAFLDGNAAPRLEQETGFTVDGVQYKVAGDVGAAAVDYRGGQKHVK